MRKTFPIYLKLTSDCKFLLEKWCHIERERERERENDRSQTADEHSNAQSPVYIWKTGLALFWSFTCCLGVYIDCVLIHIFFFFFWSYLYRWIHVSAIGLYMYCWYYAWVLFDGILLSAGLCIVQYSLSWKIFDY